MVFWTYVDRDPEDKEFVKVLEKDAEKLKKKMFKLLEEDKQKVTTISTALEITGLITALAFIVGNDLVGFTLDDVAISVILAMLVAKFDELFGSCDTVA